MSGRTITFGSILVIGAVTVWRLITRSYATPVPLNLIPVIGPRGPVDEVWRPAITVWSASALALAISFLTDLDSTLGASFGTLVAFGMIANWPKAQPAGGGSKPPKSGGGGGGGSKPRGGGCPPGYTTGPPAWTVCSGCGDPAGFCTCVNGNCVPAQRSAN